MYEKSSKITTDAWYRANRFIKALTNELGADAQADLVNKIKGLAEWPAYIQAVNDALEVAGFNGDGVANLSSDALSQTYGTVGIPLEVWTGKLLYNPSGKKGTSAYTQALMRGKAARAFADALRGAIRAFKLAVVMVNDLENLVHEDQGNPGGIADATKDPKST